MGRGGRHQQQQATYLPRLLLLLWLLRLPAAVVAVLVLAFMFFYNSLMSPMIIWLHYSGLPDIRCQTSIILSVG